VIPLSDTIEEQLKPRKERIVKCGNPECDVQFNANAPDRWLGKYCCNLCAAVADRTRTIARLDAHIARLYQYYIDNPNVRPLPPVYKDKAP
jgi:hypothetical protein